MRIRNTIGNVGGNRLLSISLTTVPYIWQGTNYWRNRILKVAKEHPDFSYAVSNKDDFQHEMSEYGLDYVA
jgi:hypothetical protein